MLPENTHCNRWPAYCMGREDFNHAIEISSPASLDTRQASAINSQVFLLNASLTQRSCPGCAHAASGCSPHASPEIPPAPSPGMQRAAAGPPSHAPPPGMLHSELPDVRPLLPLSCCAPCWGSDYAQAGLAICSTSTSAGDGLVRKTVTGTQLQHSL